MNEDVREIVLHAAVDEMMFGTFEDLDIVNQDIVTSLTDHILTALADAGKVVVDREWFEQLMEFANAERVFCQAGTWAGIFSDDPVRRAEVNLEYERRKQRRDDAWRVLVKSGMLDPLPERGE